MQSNRRPVKAFRAAFAEDFFRREIESHGFEPSFSAMGVLRKLGVDLRARGMRPSLEQSRAAVKSVLRLARTMRALAVVKRASETDLPVFLESNDRVKDSPMGVEEIRPYGREAAMDLREYRQEYYNNSRGHVQYLSPKLLEEVLHPSFKRLLRDHGLESADLQFVFAVTGKAKETREHEFEHMWSRAVHGHFDSPGEEMAAKYKGGLSSRQIILELLNPPYGSEKIYWASLGIKPRETESLMAFLKQKRVAEARLSKHAVDDSESISTTQQRLGQVHAELDAWREKNLVLVEGLEAILEAKRRVIRRVRYLQTRHGVNVNLVTALLRTNPLEQVPAIITAAVKLGKLPSGK